MKWRFLVVLSVLIIGQLSAVDALGQRVRRKGRPTMRFVNPATLPKTNGYSHVVVVNRGKTIFISGQVALDGSGNLVGRGDFAAQTEQVFKNLEAALKSSGASFKDVAKLTFFVVDRAKIQELRDVRDRYISKSNPPASSLVVVSGLVREEFLVKIDAAAVVPE